MFEKSPEVDILSKMLIESTTRRRIKNYLKCLSRTIQKMISYPRNKNINKLNSKPKFPKKNQKRNVWYRTLPRRLVCQISGWYIYFVQTFSPETVSVDDVIFRTAIWSISRHRTEIIMTFLESYYQSGWEKHIFIRK